MALDDTQTFTLLKSGHSGHIIGDDEVPSGYMSPPQNLVVSNPYEFVIDFYEFYAETSAIKFDFPSDATFALFATIRDSGIARVPLSAATAVFAQTGVSPDLARNRVTVTVPADTLPEDMVQADPVRLIFEIMDASGNELFTAFLDVILLDAEGEYGNDITITTANESVSQAVITASGALTAVPGVKTYIVKATSADVTITLPAYSAYAAQYLEFIAADVTNTITIQVAAGAFLGTSETSFTLDAVGDAAVCLGLDNAGASLQGWFRLNPRLSLR